MADPGTITKLIAFLREKPRTLKQIMGEFQITKLTARDWLSIAVARGHRITFARHAIPKRRGRPEFIYTLEA